MMHLTNTQLLQLNSEAGEQGYSVRYEHKITKRRCSYLTEASTVIDALDNGTRCLLADCKAGRLGGNASDYELITLRRRG